MAEFDLTFIRRQFPQYADPVSASLAFMENAGGSYAPLQVVEKLDHFFRRTKVQPYYPYPASSEGGAAMDRSQQLLAQSLNAAPDEIHFGPSTTMNVYVLAQALRAEMSTGDELIVTNQDHEANIGAWRRLAETGINVREWSVDPVSGLLDIEDLRPLLNARTRLVCVNHCSNIVATVNPVPAIAALVHEAGARIVVDGVSFAPHSALDMRELDVDFYLYSLYKTFGPHIGLLYAKKRHLQQIANQGHFFNAADPNKRLLPAGPDHGEIACASGIVDYYAAVYSHHFGAADAVSTAELTQAVFELFAAHEQNLMTPLLEFLKAREGVRVIGSTEPDHTIRAPTLAFTSSRVDNETIVNALAAADIGAGYGNFYAYRLMEALNIDPESGVTRLSLLHYNSLEEVQRCISVLDELI